MIVTNVCLRTMGIANVSDFSAKWNNKENIQCQTYHNQFFTACNTHLTSNSLWHVVHNTGVVLFFEGVVLRFSLGLVFGKCLHYHVAYQTVANTISCSVIPKLSPKSVAVRIYRSCKLDVPNVLQKLRNKNKCLETGHYYSDA